MAKKIYQKAYVLDVAIELAKEVGLEKLSIRGIARKLNTSVSPVYDSFESKEDIIKEIIVSVLNQNAKQDTYFLRNKDLLNYGLSYPVLYRDIQTYTRTKKIETTHLSDILTLLKKEPILNKFSDNELRTINFSLLLYISGLVQYSEIDNDIETNRHHYHQALEDFTRVIILGYEQEAKGVGKWII